MSESAKIKDLSELFTQIRLRPAMYLGASSITKFHDYLQGYSMATRVNNGIDNPVDTHFFDNFNEFVLQYYGLTFSSYNWKSIILEQCAGNEETALTTFFELYDLFMQNTKPVNTRKMVFAFLDKILFEQDDLKAKLGDNFSPIMKEAAELIKDNAMTSLKSEYDRVMYELEYLTEQYPQLKDVLADLEKGQADNQVQ